jgi:N-acylneuraminate cytidylyltransferase
MNSTLFIIPARGGSKGIPNKNILPLGGKPLICHSIDHARALTSDDNICLSTDSSKIRTVAEAYGLQVPFLRPAELATDTSPTRDTLLHAINYYREQGRYYKRIVLLQPTSPLRSPQDIRNAIELFTPGTDMVVTVKPAAANPYYDIFEEDSDGNLHISKGDGLYTRRQDAPKVWQYNGAVYVINVESLISMEMGRFPVRKASPMSPTHSIDIDSLDDWEMAEKILKKG